MPDENIDEPIDPEMDQTENAPANNLPMVVDSIIPNPGKAGQSIVIRVSVPTGQTPPTQVTASVGDDGVTVQKIAGSNIWKITIPAAAVTPPSIDVSVTPNVGIPSTIPIAVNP